MSKEPIAIVGMSCLFPGASSPDKFWENICEGRDFSKPVTHKRLGLAFSNIAGKPGDPDKAVSPYFASMDEKIDLAPFNEVPNILELDPYFHWTLHLGREALLDANLLNSKSLKRTGLILGNLTFATESASELCEESLIALLQDTTQLENAPEGLRNTASNQLHASARPAEVCAKFLNLGIDSFAIDAACASSLYVIHLAIDKLRSHQADVMLAMGVSRSETVALQVGFSQLGAYSQTGKCRPMSQEANGLIVGEGGGALTLKRLSTAIKDGDQIYGVIRGVGLSCDGRDGGLLGPSSKGQAEAMNAAFLQTGLSPSQIDLLECHGTGTPLGDQVELRSTTEVYGESRNSPLNIGSVKSMLGHCLSAAGMASTIKMLQSIRKTTFPPTLMDNPVKELLDQSAWMQSVRSPTSWEQPKNGDPRRASVSAFGFGGTNAHLILEEFQPQKSLTWKSKEPENREEALSILAMDCELGDLQGVEDLKACLLAPPQKFQSPPDGRWPQITRAFESMPKGRFLKDREIHFNQFHMSPREIEHLLPQQLLILELTQRCLSVLTQLNKSLPAKTGVLIGLNWNTNITDHTLRLKSTRTLEKFIKRFSTHSDPSALDEFLEEFRDAISDPVTADDVVGDIPNFPANRISTEFNFQGPSYVVFQEEGSALKALSLAREALLNGEVDAMIVGAVDLPLDFRNLIALKDEIQDQGPYCEGACVVVLKRESDALSAGDPVQATLRQLLTSCPDEAESKFQELVNLYHPQVIDSSNPNLLPKLNLKDRSKIIPILSHSRCKVGFARSVHGLVSVLSGAIFLRDCILPDSDPASASGYLSPSKSLPWLLDKADSPRSAIAHGLTGTGHHHFVVLEESPSQKRVTKGEDQPGLFLFSGKDLEDLKSNLANTPEKRFPDSVFSKPSRLSIVASSPTDLIAKKTKAIKLLSKATKEVRDPEGIYYSRTPLAREGAISFVYPGFGNLYPGMGTSILKRFPHLVDRMEGFTDYPRTISCTEKLWDSNQCVPSLSVFEISCATTFLSCVYTQLLICDLGIQPEKILGFSGGEIYSLLALGIWDIDPYLKKAQATSIFENEADGEFLAVQKALGIPGPIHWETHLLNLPEQKILAAIERHPGVFLTMVNSPRECVIAGLRSACSGLISELDAHSTQIGMPQVYHSNILAPLAKELQNLWNNPVTLPFNLEFYSHAAGEAIPLEQTHLSEALTRTCIEPVHFAPSLEAAYANGARIFIEVGPQSSVSRYIDTILGEREHLTCPLNLRERDDELQLLHALGKLAAQGVDMNLDSLYPTQVGAIADRSLGKPTIRVAIGRKIAGTDFSKLGKKMREYLMELPPKSSDFTDEPDLPLPNNLPTTPKELASHQQVSDHRNFIRIQDKIVTIHQSFLQDQCLQLEAQNQIQSGLSPEITRTLAPQIDPNPSLTQVLQTPKPSQPLFGPEDCLKFAEGSLAEIFGPEFNIIDGYPTRTRFPSPPYLLVDRILEIQGKLHHFEPSSIVTEFDVREDDWFLVDGRIPICVSIESGQADLFLISYLGIDHKVEGKRVYRLLGADFTFFGDYPKAPCTLRYEIFIQSYVQHEDTWLFFFEGHGTANGQPFIRWANGCAGYFTPEELAAKGLYEKPEIQTSLPEQPFIPLRNCDKTSFDRADLSMLISGDLHTCFGPGFEPIFPSQLGQIRTSPQWSSEELCMLDQVRVNPKGGSHGLGHLEAQLDLHDDHWYFTSHFKDDPVMPGTLMLNGCTQILELYLLYLGLGTQARGGHFKPVKNEEIKVKCRGQVIPGMRDLSYDVQITKIIRGACPKVFANATLTSEGREVVQIQNLAVEVKYDSLPPLPKLGTQAKDSLGRAVHANEAQLVELTSGRPSAFFGDRYRSFDDKRQISRMPNAPYSCVSRVMELEGEFAQLSPGASMRSEFDIFENDWFFQVNQGVLPYCILNEAVLQPCGLMAQLLGIDTLSDTDRFIRNLSGKIQIGADLFAQNTQIHTQVVLKEVVDTPDVFMVKFDGHAWLPDGTELAQGIDLHFGFFSKAGLASTPGIPGLEVAIPKTDFASLPLPRELGEGVRLPEGPGLFIDRVLSFDETGGAWKRGRLLVEKIVNPKEWIFFSHFYQDPVVPGSYSLDAVGQILRYYLIHQGMAMSPDSYLRVHADCDFSWSYRGQILPSHRQVLYQVDIKDVQTGQYPLVRADATVFCDQKAIYTMEDATVSVGSR
jgi:PfaB family protein